MKRAKLNEVLHVNYTNLDILLDDSLLPLSSVCVRFPHQDNLRHHCPVWLEATMVQPMLSPPCQPPLRHARHQDSAITV